jgi:nucleotidyltransferase/DNA polymerase involved in DNA repair
MLLNGSRSLTTNYGTTLKRWARLFLQNIKTWHKAGFREIEELARLNDGEALALFGTRGPLLRDTALGIDDSQVASGSLGEKIIEGRLDFAGDVIDFELIRGDLFHLAEQPPVGNRPGNC